MNNSTQKNETSLEMQKRLLDYQGEDQIIEHEELLRQAQAQPPIMIKTKFDRFDFLLGGGIEETDLAILTGNTNNGKTTFGIALAVNLSEQGIETCYFSFEMGNIQVVRRFPQFPQKTHLLCMPAQYTHKNLKWLEDRIVEAKIKFNAKVIFLDNLDFIVPLLFSSNLDISTRFCIQTLKTITIKHNIALMLTAHTRKNSGDPDIMDIKDSKSIGDLSDWAAVVSLIDREQGKGNVKLIKNRHEWGHMGSIFTLHDFQTRETSEMNEEQSKAIETATKKEVNLKELDFTKQL